jgi:hypothetical protein
MLSRSRFRAPAALATLAALLLELLLLATASVSQPQESAPNERTDRGAQLTLQILGEGGSTVFCRVCLRGEDERETCSPTDRIGTVTFFRLTPGSYNVIVFKGSQQIWTDQTMIPDRFSVQSDITWPARKILRQPFR